MVGGQGQGFTFPLPQMLHRRRRAGTSPTRVNKMMAGITCWCTHQRKRVVVPGRDREVSAEMGWRVSPSGSAFEMLERYAVKVARTVLRAGRGSNATPLPDERLWREQLP
jgi:hypothetical protein